MLILDILRVTRERYYLFEDEMILGKLLAATIPPTYFKTSFAS